MAKKTGDKPEYLSPDKLDRIENVVAGDLFFSTFYRVLRYSGRRIGEIVGTPRKVGSKTILTGGVKLKDIDFEHNEMKTVILKTKKRRLLIECSNPECKFKASYKNKFCPRCGTELPEFDKSKLKYSIPETVTMPLRSELPSILRAYIQNCRPKLKAEDYVFRKYSLVYLKQKIKTHCIQASITENFSLHGYRHCFVTNLKKAGLTNEQIALWTGHKTPDTLQLYTHMIPDDIRDKIMDVKL